MLIFEKDLPTNFDYEQLLYALCNMAKFINECYVYELFVEVKNRVVLYSMDNTVVDIENCPCGLVYNVIKEDDEINVYIMFIATEYRYRKAGYASLFIKEFIHFITEKYRERFTNISIVLDSVEPAVTFYEHFGFTWTITDEKHKSVFDIDETNENEHFMMVYKCAKYSGDGKT